MTKSLISEGDARDRFSVYYAKGNNQRAYGRLSHLAPMSLDEGWHVARNLLKPLNHIDLLREKERIANLLGLGEGRASPALDGLFDVLTEHQSGRLRTEAVIDLLASQRQISTSEVSKLLAEYSSVTHIEFHPTDVCNLECAGCTYGHDDPARKPLPINFPFDALSRLADLRPRSMVVIGGGEPTLYKDDIYRFQELIDAIYASMPNIELALVTNGTFRPRGDWPRRFSWIRLSLDAATRETYAAFRGKDHFDAVLRNLLAYIRTDVRSVGISFLFARPNIHEYSQVAEMVYSLVKREAPKDIHKLNIQYRPLRRDPRDYSRRFDLAVTEEQVERAVNDVIQLASTSAEMATFLREQTNVTAVLGGNSHPPHEFDRCYYSQIFRIVRASGQLRPCFIRVEEPDFALGNITKDSLQRISLNELYIALARKQDCDSHGCRQCHVNYVLQEGLKSSLLPSSSLAVRSDPMF